MVPDRINDTNIIDLTHDRYCTQTVAFVGSLIEHNDVVQHGSAIFFVSNDHSGDIRIEHSRITQNTGGSWYPTYPQISNHDDTPIVVVDSVIE